MTTFINPVLTSIFLSVLFLYCTPKYSNSSHYLMQPFWSSNNKSLVFAPQPKKNIFFLNLFSNPIFHILLGDIHIPHLRNTVQQRVITGTMKPQYDNWISEKCTWIQSRWNSYFETFSNSQKPGVPIRWIKKNLNYFSWLKRRHSKSYKLYHIKSIASSFIFPFCLAVSSTPFPFPMNGWFRTILLIFRISFYLFLNNPIMFFFCSILLDVF